MAASAVAAPYPGQGLQVNKVAPAAPGGFSVLSESEPVIEVNEVNENQFDVDMFFQAHPEFACALLSPPEVQALCVLAQQSAYETEGVSIMDAKNFNKVIVLFSKFGFELGFRTAGWVDTSDGKFGIKTFLFVKTPFGQPEIKGPSLDGTLNTHIGPIKINLPGCGNLDIWVKVENNSVVFTIQVVVFGNPIKKSFAIPL
ncbi:hypothetical protein BKA62DRAFT_824221 [Auriculariales sp. MPI-PUGE-AT-0066]|nr:hypothetical protein BKA62DRAFT_824221 [Auriculariales sp. MPI-PUGE-AT-0066]